MEVCNKCNREFKTVSGLKIHLKSCAIQSNIDDNDLVSKTMDEPKEAVFDGTVDVERVVDKLRDMYKSTYDAKSRYDIECEIKSLGYTLRC